MNCCFLHLCCTSGSHVLAQVRGTKELQLSLRYEPPSPKFSRSMQGMASYRCMGRMGGGAVKQQQLPMGQCCRVSVLHCAQSCLSAQSHAHIISQSLPLTPPPALWLATVTIPFHLHCLRQTRLPLPLPLTVLRNQTQVAPRSKLPLPPPRPSQNLAAGQGCEGGGMGRPPGV